MKTIYCAHPLSLADRDNIHSYYESIRKDLRDFYDVTTPMYKTARLTREERGDVDDPMRCNHAIFKRDTWLVDQADIVLCDFTGSEVASIGCSMELAIAHWSHKHVVVVLPPNNIHDHAFIKEAADILFTDVDSAIDYLKQVA